MQCFLSFWVATLVPTFAQAQAPAEPPPVVVLVEIAPAAPATLPPAPVVVTPALLDESADALAPAELESVEPEAFEPGLVSLGLSGLVGTRDGGDELAPTWIAGLDLGVRLEGFVSLGIRRLFVTALAQARDAWVVGASPYVELGGRPIERVELYAQLGAALQLRIDDAVGAAPFVGTGVRFFPADIFSIAIEGAVHVPVTQRFALGHETFPFGAVVLQGGLAFAFHLG